MKISFLLLLCLATFILNFNANKEAIKQKEEEEKKAKKSKNSKEKDDAIEDANKIEQSFNDDNKKTRKKRVRSEINRLRKSEKEKLKNSDIFIIDSVSDDYKRCENDDFVQAEYEYEYEIITEEEEDIPKEKKLTFRERKERDKKRRLEIKEKTKQIKETYLYQYKACNPGKKLIKFLKYIEDNESKISSFTDGISEITKCIQKGFLNTKFLKNISLFKNKDYLKMSYNGFKKAFIQQVKFYETNKFPSIIEIVGYSIHRKKQDLYVDYKENGSLENIINSCIKLNSTQKLIIAYGIASALEFLHNHEIVHRSVNPLSILLDSKFYPYLSQFYNAKFTKIKYKYVLLNSRPGFEAPEFIEDCRLNQNSFGLDIYSFGMTLYILIKGINPFINMKAEDITKMALSEDRSYLTNALKNLTQQWANLIEMCCNKNPIKRPSFENICDMLESDLFVNDSIDINAFNKYKKIINRQKKNPSNCDPTANIIDGKLIEEYQKKCIKRRIIYIEDENQQD